MIKVEGFKQAVYEASQIAAIKYMSLNSELFRSTVAGPAGATGAQGERGVGIHHLKGTHTTDLEGDFISSGEVDTYTFYEDADEELPLAWFKVRNGKDAFQYAKEDGYEGDETEFGYELSNLRKFYESAEEDAAATAEDRAQVEEDAAQVATDRTIVENAKDIVVDAKDITLSTAATVQDIFLGTKASDPTVDNFGNPLEIGVIYYNSTANTLRVWDGTTWSLGAFSVAGAVATINGRDGAVEITNADITAAVGTNLSTVEYGATADQTASEIKSLYEGTSNKVLSSVDKISLNTAGSVSAVGDVAWDAEDRALAVALGNAVVLQVGQETIVKVTNTSGSTIANGTVVMMVTSPGNSGKLVVAPYDGVSPAYKIVGIATESISNNADGLVTSYGLVRGLNTSAWTKDSELYVNGSGLGTASTTSLKMRLAVVISQHATNGTVFVRLNGYSQTEEW